MSNATASIFFNLAALANSNPTLFADSVFLPVREAGLALPFDLKSPAETKVTPFASSIIWAKTYLLDRKTESRGQSLVPFILALTLLCLISFFEINLFIRFYAAAVAAFLPAFLLIISFSYLIPVPLYGSGFLKALTSALNWPIVSLS